MFSSTDELSPLLGTLGRKSRRLLELAHEGYPVPPFIVITSEEIIRAFSGDQHQNSASTLMLVNEIRSKLSSPYYAVRSAMHSEDLDTSANAGQFKTELKVDGEGLAQAIISVIEDALKKLPNGLHDCSIIVQEYIEPQHAGVIFTRNPLGGTEMVVEYRTGVGDKVVGGEAVKRLRFSLNDGIKHERELPTIERLSKLAHEIEKRYDFPQDIEWAVGDEEVFILQSRPITSLSPGEWQGIKLVEREFSSSDNFYFEKTALSESFPHPRPLALSILSALHEEGGPIEGAYTALGIHYSAQTDLFRLVGTSLYVDRYREIKTLFPSLGYIPGTERTHWETWRGSLRTLMNIWSLQRRSPKRYEAERTALIQASKYDLSLTTSLEECFSLLLRQYAIIFEITISAQKALTEIETHLGKDRVYLSGLLAKETNDDTPNETITHIPDHLRGNSLNIDDTSIFSSKFGPGKVVDHTIDTWWNSLPKWKQIGLTPFVERATKYLSLRETARTQSVRLINRLRELVEKRASAIFPNTPNLIYFTTISELLSGTENEEIAHTRKQHYEANLHLVTPPYIASFIKGDREGNLGISPGIASGTFVDVKNINSVSGKKILYTDILSPDLVQYFDRIVGIVSRNGGLLSHLAIMAREAHIPVVVVDDRTKITLGLSGEIDGLSGKILITK